MTSQAPKVHERFRSETDNEIMNFPIYSLKKWHKNKQDSMNVQVSAVHIR